MKKLSLAIISTIISSSFAAGSWVLLGISNNSELYVKADTRKYFPESRLASIWAKQVYLDGEVINGKIASHSVSQNNFNCVERTSYVKVVHYYNKSGTVIGTFNNLPYKRYKEQMIIPDTVGEAIFDAACFGEGL